MELKEQRYVVTLADTKNLTKAAKKLNISQPALSLYIKNLENSLGEALFSRENRKIVPTYFGELYIAKARQILEIGHKFEAEFQSMKNGAKGKVSFGLTYWLSAVLLPAVLPLFRSAYPEVELDVLEAPSEESLLESLREHRLDFAVVEDAYPEFDQTIIAKDNVYLLVSSNSDFARKHANNPSQRIPMADLSGFLFLLHCPFEEFDKQTISLKSRYGLSGNQVMPLKSMESILLLVQQNFGASLITETQLKYYDTSGLTTFAVDDPAYQVTVYTTTPKDEIPSDYAETLVRLIHSKFSDGPDTK